MTIEMFLIVKKITIEIQSILSKIRNKVVVHSRTKTLKILEIEKKGSYLRPYRQQY